MAIYGRAPALVGLGISENLKNRYDIAAMSVTSRIRDLFVKQEDREYECISKCMENLSPQEQQVVLTLGAQREDDKAASIRQMRELAVKLGITYNDLSSEVQRTRAKLKHCVRKCRSELRDAESHTRRKNGT